MKNWLKSYLNSTKTPKNSLIKPIQPNNINPKHNPLSKITKKTYNPLSNLLKFDDVKPLIRPIKKPINEKDSKYYWLEKWYLFRDRYLANPFDRMTYAFQVAVKVVGKILLRNKKIYGGCEMIKEVVYKLQCNEKFREYFVPGLIVFVMIIIFLSLS